MSSPVSPSQATDIWSRFTSNKHLFFVCMGLLGGLLGALLAEPTNVLANLLPRRVAGNAFFIIFKTVVWASIFSTAIAFSLMIAERFYRRNQQSIWNILPRAVGAGALGGIVGGGFAQLLFGLMPDGWFTDIFVRAFCWGLMGVVVGCGISLFIPNMKLIRGALGGFCGGLMGGFGFTLVATIMGLFKNLLGLYFAEFISRLAGIGILGVTLGLAVVIAERLLQKASLEIIWAPRQTSRITLGEKPVTIGSRGDDVVIPGLESNTASVVLSGGNVQYTDNRTGSRSNLKNGSKLEFGKVELVVHAIEEGSSADEPTTLRESTPEESSADEPTTPTEPTSDAALGQLTLEGPDGGSMSVRVTTAVGKSVASQFGEDAQFLSEPQFTLEKTEAGYWVVLHDSKAKNETLLNGKAVKVSESLKDADELAVGRESKGIIKLPLKIKIS